MREQIEEVSVDMWGGFPKVVETVFPKATLVIDRFHVMQATHKELDKFRRQAKVYDRGSKFILLRNGVDLTERQQSKLDQYLERSKRLRKAYELKEAGLFRVQGDKSGQCLGIARVSANSEKTDCIARYGFNRRSGRAHYL